MIKKLSHSNCFSYGLVIIIALLPLSKLIETLQQLQQAIDQSINRKEAHGGELIKLLKHLPFEGISARVSDGEAVIISSTADRVLIMSATAAKRPLAWPWVGRGRARACGRMLGTLPGCS